MIDVFSYVPAIVLLPFFSFLIALGVGKYLPKGRLRRHRGDGRIVPALAVGARDGRRRGAANRTLYTWASAGGIGPTDVELSFGILIDPLSALMLVIVTLVALLVHVVLARLHERTRARHGAAPVLRRARPVHGLDAWVRRRRQPADGVHVLRAGRALLVPAHRLQLPRPGRRRRRRRRSSSRGSGTTSS